MNASSWPTNYSLVCVRMLAHRRRLVSLSQQSSFCSTAKCFQPRLDCKSWVFTSICLPILKASLMFPFMRVATRGGKVWQARIKLLYNWVVDIFFLPSPDVLTSLLSLCVGFWTQWFSRLELLQACLSLSSPTVELDERPKRPLL